MPPLRLAAANLLRAGASPRRPGEQDEPGQPGEPGEQGDNGARCNNSCSADLRDSKS